MMESTKKTFVILGGGTAGWMSAILLAAAWQQHDFKIIVAESPRIGTIGVGEGSTPTLKKFFDFLNITEAEWMPECHATYKTGIEFIGWSDKPEYPRYFHAFDTDLDCHTQPAFIHNCDVKRMGVAINADPSEYYIGAELARRSRIPIANDNFPFEVGYAYHFDATKLGEFIRRKAEELGVIYQPFTVAQVKKDPQGNIVELQDGEGAVIRGDFFIDCSGFASRLMEQELGVGHVSYRENLFNNAAVALATPATQYQPKTQSTALSSGWVWDIPLQSRTGHGYVYSDEFLSADEAETELRQFLGATDSESEARHLKMRVGRIERTWANNCLAVGLSQGFIEPLEATALFLVQTTLQNFIDAYELGGFTETNQSKFNKKIEEHFEGVRDYIVAHYVCSGRTDSEYWREVKNSAKPSDRLAALLNAWVNGGDVAGLIDEYSLDRFYTQMSWYSLLSGYGLYLPEHMLKPGTDKAYRHDVNTARQFLQRSAMNFGPIHG